MIEAVVAGGADVAVGVVLVPVLVKTELDELVGEEEVEVLDEPGSAKMVPKLGM